MKILERDLRVFVKNCFEKNSNVNETLFFVEAGKGGSDGNADVFWARDGVIYPIELKIFKDGFYLRPAQYSFHRSCQKAKCKSFVVAIVVDKKDFSKNRLLILDGKAISDFRHMKQKQLLELSNKKSNNLFWFMDEKGFEGVNVEIFRACFYEMMLSFFKGNEKT